ncbi:MAG: hypothetical protein KatS3mg044_1355 [Rhodothermaceae bacterium]|nr:MAG: hypothetical protein KatS3mg044_1355 [Rhodothermaceae bacterium]
MPTDLLHPEDVSVETLKQIFDQAYLETTIDADGHLFVEDGQVGCYVFPSENGKDIRFAGFATPRQDASLLQRLTFANHANQTFKIVRTYVIDSGKVVFDYYLCVDGGITPRALVMTFRRFVGIPVEILNECDTENLFG